MTLELLRAEVAQRGMLAKAILNVVDEPRKILSDVSERLLGDGKDGVDYERLHEALSLGVVVWVVAPPFPLEPLTVDRPALVTRPSAMTPITSDADRRRDPAAIRVLR